MEQAVWTAEENRFTSGNDINKFSTWKLDLQTLLITKNGDMEILTNLVQRTCSNKLY
jgi:hypothetical protein